MRSTQHPNHAAPPTNRALNHVEPKNTQREPKSTTRRGTAIAVDSKCAARRARRKTNSLTRRRKKRRKIKNLGEARNHTLTTHRSWPLTPAVLSQTQPCSSRQRWPRSKRRRLLLIKRPQPSIRSARLPSP